MDKKVIVKKDWISSFNLVGTPKISENYTFKIDARSEKSNWIYNSINLGVDCGEKYGIIYAELMGGYSENNENRIFAHGKKDDGSDDFEKQIVVPWDDRFNDDVLEKIGDMSFISVGLEKTDKGNTYVKKFLSAYDAIAYIQEHLTENMVINVRGNLKYSSYNDTTQVKKVITSIFLSKAEDSSQYKATFTQSVLIDKYSASLKNVDKTKGIMYVDGKVLDYVKEINGIEIKGQYPYAKQFEYALDLKNENKCKTIYDALFKVKKGYNQITFKGEFIENGAMVTPTIDTIPEHIKTLFYAGVYSEEEAIAVCTANGNRERRMVLRAPFVKLVGEEKNPVVQIFEERYEEDDLNLDWLYSNDENGSNEQIDIDEDDDDLDWLSKIE